MTNGRGSNFATRGYRRGDRGGDQGAAIATGAYPARNGIVGNSYYDRAVDPTRSFSTDDYRNLQRLEAATGDMVLAKSLGELLAERGRRLAAVSSGTGGSALLTNYRAREGVGVLVAGYLEPSARVAFPSDVNDVVLRRFGPAPVKGGDVESQDAAVAWTQRVLREYVPIWPNTGGGADKRVLPLAPLFDGIAANPGAPEYWWLYALLFSTMIPSLINLMIGGASFIRGVPGLPTLLLRFMPAGKAVPSFDRQWLALVLTSQVFFGALLGIAAQAFLAVVVIFHILPWFGLELLDTARDVAEFDLPMRVMRLF
jgi:hypothetical protein